MSKSVLIIEDEVRMRILIRDYLKRENYEIYEASNGIDGINIFNEKRVDLIVLDIMMPFMDGWEVCKNIRQKSTVPIIMLTAKSEEDDKLLGYELGADDYITKPFSVKILMAKIKAIFNRVDAINSEEPSIIDIDGLKIDELSHEVSIDNKSVILSPKEYELLLYLVKNKGIALSRSQILDSVWGMDYYGDARTVDTNIKRLREKLGEKSYLIATVRGSGYRLEVRK